MTTAASSSEQSSNQRMHVLTTCLHLVDSVIHQLAKADARMSVAKQRLCDIVFMAYGGAVEITGLLPTALGPLATNFLYEPL